MSRTTKKLERVSLAQCFEGPDEVWRGRFGWLCGYSADGDFLNQAAERFTRQTASQRAHGGAIALAAMLDPGNPAISILEAPGVAHLPILDAPARPFALLHAKVALLGFCHRDDPDDWIVRLIVSTGNWTRQTVEESLDLVWCIDVRASELKAPTPETQQRCADIAAAREMLNWLGTLFDRRLLDLRSHAQASETGIAMAQVEEWLDRCTRNPALPPARFVSNRRQSLLAQLPEQLRHAGITRAVNCLAMASGYYESAANPHEIPSVLAQTLAQLKESALLVKHPEVYVFVNPRACQAIAASARALNDAKIQVHGPSTLASIFGDDNVRTLHAKFLFGANFQKNSIFCLDAWVYLGSGNLTQPGFTHAMHRQGGNLEAGVVFAPQGLLWKPNADYSPYQAIENVLPVQWDTPIDLHELQAGGDMPERPDVFQAAPVAWLRWQADADEHGTLVAPHAESSFDVLNTCGEPCAQSGDRYSWTDARPRTVSVRWRANDTVFVADVPVVDEFGRVAATPLPALELDEAWWRLANFPLPAGADDAASEEAGVDGALIPRGGPLDRTHGSYAVREMMEFIEQLAERQTAIVQADWSAWCCRLEQTLMLLADSAGVATFRDLDLNPLDALRVPCFRPPYAETDETEAGRVYEAVIASVELKWDVAALSPIGAFA
ncbi:phospholipase D-like domain-containing protein [Paraburkholderia bannensis]|uniref:hypothetical protein n=1 Tax=Paraburkholderia bannensis TaxID=765414 RepID=UPI002AB60F41|nr:hypothetical protein [Paraburkholderia bannensis]